MKKIFMFMMALLIAIPSVYADSDNTPEGEAFLDKLVDQFASLYDVDYATTTYSEVKNMYPGKEKVDKKDNSISWKTKEGVTFYKSKDGDKISKIFIEKKDLKKPMPADYVGIDLNESASSWQTLMNTNGVSANMTFNKAFGFLTMACYGNRSNFIIAFDHGGDKKKKTMMYICLLRH